MLFEVSRLGAAGLTWGMRYLTSNDPHVFRRLPDSFAKEMLDWSHADGLYVMFDLHTYFSELAHGNGSAAEIWSNISREVSG